MGDWAKLHGATLLAINDKDHPNSSAAPPPFLFSFVLLDWLCEALHAQPCHADSTFGLTAMPHVLHCFEKISLCIVCRCLPTFSEGTRLWHPGLRLTVSCLKGSKFPDCFLLASPASTITCPAGYLWQCQRQISSSPRCRPRAFCYCVLKALIRHFHACQEGVFQKARPYSCCSKA